MERLELCCECWRVRVCAAKKWLPVTGEDFHGVKRICKHFIAADPEYEAELAAARRKYNTSQSL